MPLSPLDELSQIPEPFLVTLAHGVVPGERRKLVQHGLQPDSIDSRLLQPSQVAVRIRVRRAVEQWVAVEGEVGVAETKVFRRSGVQVLGRWALGLGRWGRF